MIEGLRLHSFLMPMLEHAEQTMPEFAKTALLSRVRRAEVYDCRPLPLGFVTHTGSIAWDEAKEHGQPIRLPSPLCYFELDEARGVLAIEGQRRDDGKLAIQLFPFFLFGPDDNELSIDTPTGVERMTFATGTMLTKYLSCFGLNVATFWPTNAGQDNHGVREVDGGFLRIASTKFDSGEKYDDQLERVWSGFVVEGGKSLLGVLSLLEDRLIEIRDEPDRAKYTNAKRMKKGKLPLSCEHKVLTINTAAARAAARPATGTHESPRLHWRRGHWRHLAKGRVWVRRCLVGDPERGFVEKDYRIEHRPPAEAPPVRPPPVEPPAPQPIVPPPRSVLRRLRRFFGGAA